MDPETGVDFKIFTEWSVQRSYRWVWVKKGDDKFECQGKDDAGKKSTVALSLSDREIKISHAFYSAFKNQPVFKPLDSTQYAYKNADSWGALYHAPSTRENHIECEQVYYQKLFRPRGWMN